VLKPYEKKSWGKGLMLFSVALFLFVSGAWLFSDAEFLFTILLSTAAILFFIQGYRYYRMGISEM